METTYTYKEQGDGRDSWICEVTDKGELVDKYMVYEDPTKPKTTDIASLLKTQTPEQLAEIKTLLAL